MVFCSTIKFDNKIIREQDLIILAKGLTQLYRENDRELEYSVYFKDNNNNEIKDSSLDIFTSSAFTRRKSEKIEMKYYSNNLTNSVLIYLYDSSHQDKCSIRIESNDEKWFNQVNAQMQQIIDEIENQNIVSKLDNSSAKPILATIISVLLIFLEMMGLSSLYSNQMQFVFIVCALMLFVDMTISVNLVNSVFHAYPRIEFAFGPDYKNTASKNKKILGWLLSAIIIPAVFFVFGFLLS